jgi:putative mycofactocin binding protein MftB
VETPFDIDRQFVLHEQVALRPEPFGALAYHFGTRRLSFLKSRKLLAVVQHLDAERTCRDACKAAGVDDAELPQYALALATLTRSGMLRQRTEP